MLCLIDLVRKFKMSGVGASSGSSNASTSCHVATDSTPPSEDDLSYPLWKFYGER